MEKEIPHIGKIIQKKMKEEGLKAFWLAQKIHCDTSIVYRIYKQQHPDIKRLIDICFHLNINLFSHYSDYIQQQIEKKK